MKIKHGIKYTIIKVIKAKLKKKAILTMADSVSGDYVEAQGTIVQQ